MAASSLTALAGLLMALSGRTANAAPVPIKTQSKKIIKAVPTSRSKALKVSVKHGAAKSIPKPTGSKRQKPVSSRGAGTKFSNRGKYISQIKVTNKNKQIAKDVKIAKNKLELGTKKHVDDELNFFVKSVTQEVLKENNRRAKISKALYTKRVLNNLEKINGIIYPLNKLDPEVHMLQFINKNHKVVRQELFNVVHGMIENFNELIHNNKKALANVAGTNNYKKALDKFYEKHTKQLNKIRNRAKVINGRVELTRDHYRLVFNEVHMAGDMKVVRAMAKEGITLDKYIYLSEMIFHVSPVVAESVYDNLVDFGISLYNNIDTVQSVAVKIIKSINAVMNHMELGYLDKFAFWAFVTLSSCFNILVMCSIIKTVTKKPVKKGIKVARSIILASMLIMVLAMLRNPGDAATKIQVLGNYLSPVKFPAGMAASQVRQFGQQIAELYSI